MKSIVASIVAAAVTVPAVAGAIVHPPGTVQEYVCGSTATFPTSTNICAASVVGSSSEYLVVSTSRELEPGASAPVFLPVVAREISEEGRTVRLTAKEVVEGIERTLTLIVDYSNPEGIRGTMLYDGQPFFGSEDFPMETISHIE